MRLKKIEKVVVWAAARQLIRRVCGGMAGSHREQPAPVSSQVSGPQRAASTSKQPGARATESSQHQ